MRRRNTELLYAFLAIVLITAIYFLVTLTGGSTLDPAGIGGHLLGVVGFVFMLLTELLYSIRKHARRAARWGRMETWLKFHIFTGLVGPYLVLLHTSWQFKGLAGVVTLLTLVIVLSGFIGRYIYTAVPRTLDGVELDRQDLESQADFAVSSTREWLSDNAELGKSLPPNIFTLPVVQDNIWSLFGGRILSELRYKKTWRKAKRQLESVIDREQIRNLDKILTRQREVQSQKAYIVTARRLLALWHTVHVPIGIGLFALAFIHIGAAVYYVTLAR